MVNHAIILAAGLGQRLRARSASKPLTQVHSLSLIEIGVRQLHAAGIAHIVVVTGHEADRVEAHIDALAHRLDLDLRCVRLEDWSRPNGWSVIAGAGAVDAPFVLVMADHMFGDGLLARLAGQSLDQCDVVLATDRVDNPLVDPDDATWAARDDQARITAIGKHIAPYDAVDCGAFLANVALPRAIERAIAQGAAGSLSDGMQVLADARRAMTMDIAGAWWLDVDDPRALDLALDQAPDHLDCVRRAAMADGGGGGDVG